MLKTILAIFIYGTCAGLNPCPAPGPCALEAHQILCWDAGVDSPNLHYEVCAMQNPLIAPVDLGCHSTQRIEYAYTLPDGSLVDVVHQFRLVAPLKYFDAAPGSMVTLTVRSVNVAGTSAWVLMDIVDWPIVFDLQTLPARSHSKQKQDSP